MIDETALQLWLSTQLGADRRIEQCRRIATGHSRAMWFILLDNGDRFVVRVEQGGVFGTNGVDEFELMRAAERLGCPVATVRWCEPTGDVLGQPFFVMDYVDSKVAAREDRTLPDAVAADLVRCLHALHTSNRRAEPHLNGNDGDGTHAQIERWRGVYRSAADVAVPLLDEAATWLHRHAPVANGASIVHGDPGPGNFLHDGSRVVALTDWEFAHVGDPTEDWVYLVAMRGARTMPAAQWRALITRESGVELTDWDMRYWSAFNFFKGACANLTCLRVLADGTNAAPNMVIIGSALQQTFMRSLADLVAG
jgi:aminoglycoside phosphotransferase (APT) family kinase protein